MRFLVLLLIGVLVGCAEKTLEQRTESGDTQFNLGAMYQMGNGSLKAGFGEWEQVLQVLDLFGCTAIPCLVLFFIFIPFMEVVRRDWEKGLNRAWLVFSIIWWVGGFGAGRWYDEFQSVSLLEFLSLWILTPLAVAGLWKTWVDGYARMGDKDV